MSKKLPREIQDNIKAVRFMAIVMAIVGAITIIGIPWAVLYVILAFRLKENRLPNRRLLNLTALATILIIWCLVPIFLLVGLLKLSHKSNLLNSKGGRRLLKTDKDWGDFKAWRRYGLAFGMMGLLVLIMVSFLPIPHTSSKIVRLAYETDYTMTPKLELGQRATEQEGIIGRGETKTRKVTPFFAYIFGIDAQYSSEQLQTKTIKAPKNAEVAKGTKKYQYMWCSDGSYRYYSDAQFKDPGTGFTHKGLDYCAKNNDGHMIQLASSAPAGNSFPTNKADMTMHNVAAGCTKKNIVPYKTVKENVSYLAKGQTEIGFEGEDGFTQYCPDLPNGQKSTKYEPINRHVYIGIGSTAAEKQQKAKEQSKAEEQRIRQEAINDRNYDVQACISRLRAQAGVSGAGNSSFYQEIPSLCQSGTPSLSHYIAALQ